LGHDAKDWKEIKNVLGGVRSKNLGKERPSSRTAQELGKRKKRLLLPTESVKLDYGGIIGIEVDEESLAQRGRGTGRDLTGEGGEKKEKNPAPPSMGRILGSRPSNIPASSGFG